MTSDSEYRNYRVFLTGAGGFIGSHLAEALVRSGARVRASVRYTSHGSCGHLERVLPRSVIPWRSCWVTFGMPG